MKKIIFLLSVLLTSAQALGVCVSLVKGQVAFNVNKCGRLSPEKTFKQKHESLQFISDLSPEDKKIFYNSYRGLVVEGLVVRSLAIKSGLSQKRGALNGENIKAFIEPGNLSCGKILNKRIRANLDEACCEGGGAAPCLLNMTYVFKDVTVLGKTVGGAGNAKRMSLDRNKEYQKANSYLRKKKFDKALPIYKSLKEAGELDLRGHFFYGYALRMEDKCKKALPILEEIHKKSEANSYWANEEKVVKKGLFLYSRCLAKTGKASESIQVLQGFLANPKRYKREIKASFTNPDFGRIKTTVEFQSYMNDAQKALENQ